MFKLHIDWQLRLQTKLRTETGSMLKKFDYQRRRNKVDDQHDSYAMPISEIFYKLSMKLMQSEIACFRFKTGYCRLWGNKGANYSEIFDFPKISNWQM